MANDKEKPKTLEMVLEAVHTMQNITIFGQNVKQFSSTMTNIHIRPDGTDVVVTHDSFPGVEERIHAPAIAKTTWKAAK